MDASTDVYSLGVTLYELLTLRPAFDAADRQELIQRILDDEPTPPRRLQPSIPRDLETIVLKAMEKEPAARYASAAALADDLRRFLDDEPIRAHRPGVVDRLMKWSRRHKPAVVAALVALFLTLAFSTVVSWAAKTRTDATLNDFSGALAEERLALEYALGEFDMIARPLVDIETLYEFSRFLKNDPDDAPEADATFRRALAVADAMIADPETARPCSTMNLVGPLNDLAWALVVRPDVAPADAARALRLALKITEWEPKQAGFWNTLGVASCRLGRRPAAASAFQKSMDLNNGGDPSDWLFLAALDHQAGRNEEARRRFDQSLAWMEQNKGKNKAYEAQLARFRDEIARATGLK